MAHPRRATLGASVSRAATWQPGGPDGARDHLLGAEPVDGRGPPGPLEPLYLPGGILCIVVAITFDAPVKAAYSKFPNPASRYAMAGVFVAKASDGGVRVAVTGAGSNGVFRHTGLEAALSANWSADAAAGITVDASDLLSDIHGSAEYRANLVKVMAKRAVAAT